MVDLQKILGDIFDNVLSDFAQLCQPDFAGPDRESSEQRKQRLLAHLHATRQQLLRALVLLNWKPWKVLAELVDHERVADIAAAHVRTMHEAVGQMRQQAVGRIMAGSYLNMYDVNTALEVLTTGTYQELPSIILHRPPLFQPPPASLARQKARLAHVTHLIRSRLVQVALPPGLKVVSVSNGSAVLRAEGLYEARLTLVPSEPLPGVDDAAGAGGATGAAAAADAADCGAGWAAAAAAAAAADPVASASAGQRWKWRLIHFVLCIGVPFYDPRQPGQILNTCNFHMVLAADNAAYLARQRRTGGGGAAAAAAAGGAVPAPSESAATPAASGLPSAGGAAAAAAGGGGVSLAAAVKRAQDDEVGAPLAVMHAILTDVAGRLLADELAAAARALAAPGSRWHGHIAVKPSSLLSPGVRIEYWVAAPPLLSQRALPAPTAAGEDYRGVKPGPPYLELGMGEGGCVEVLHSPSSLHKPVAVSKLRLDTFRVNVEEVLMRAANMSAQFQLLQIRHELKQILLEAMGKRAPTLRVTTLARQLWCRDGHALQQPGTEEADEAAAAAQEGATAAADGGTADGAAGSTAAPMDVDTGAGGSSAAAAMPPPPPPPIPPPSAPAPEVSGLLACVAPAEEAAGALVLLNAPVLEYLVAGTTELKIGKHLFSGRLTLRPGQDERDEGSLDHAATIAMHEDSVNAAALGAYNSAAAAADAFPAARALREACSSLSHVLQRTHTSTDATHFIQAARRASLHVSRLPHGLLEAFAATCPSLAIEPRPREKVATWALQGVPFPPNFPPLEGFPHAEAPAPPPLRVPACLAFFLQSRLSLTSPHVLVVVACNKQLMPIKVLSCIPVPPSTYRLPEHVVAAYMAVSSAGHGHAHGQGHGHGAAGGGGGGGAGGAGPGTGGSHGGAQPHGGGSSPPAFMKGHEVGARSPDASPARDVSGAAATTATAGGGSFSRPSAGGGTSALAASDAAAGSAGVGIGGCSAGGAGALTSGNPSLPSAASPPQPLPHGRVSSGGDGGAAAATYAAHHQGNGTAAGGHAHGGPAAAAAASPKAHAHGSVSGHGRPTGQQVAMMLAQQQLSSVVRWCRRRMVWETLLVQLQAVGAAFEELCWLGPPPPPPQAPPALPRSGSAANSLHGQGQGHGQEQGRANHTGGPGGQNDHSHSSASASHGQLGLGLGLGQGQLQGPGRLRVTSIAGTPLPCQLARRRGLSPARVGPTCLELELGPDALAGQFTARLYGRFLCAPACAPPLDGGGAAGACAAAVGTGFVLEPLRDAAGAGAAGAAAAAGDVVCLRRRYWLERGESALTLVQEVAAIIRMQTLLARLEMTVRPTGGAGGARRQPQQQLAVLAAPGAAAAAAARTAAGAAGPAHAGARAHAQSQLAGGRIAVKAEGSCAAVGVGAPPAAPHGGPASGLGAAWDGAANGYGLPPAPKRIKTEPGLPDGAHAPYAHGDGTVPGSASSLGQQPQAAGMANGFHGASHPNGVGGEPGAAAARPPDAAAEGLTWHWPLVGTVRLEQYGCSTATLSFTPCSAADGVGQRQGASGAAAVAAEGGPPPPPVLLHLTWAPRDPRSLHSGAGAGAAGAAPTSPGGSSPTAATPIGFSPAASSTPSKMGTASSAGALLASGPLASGSLYLPAGSAAAGAGATAAAAAAAACGTTTRAVLVRPSTEPFGRLFSDVVLCTICCVSGHTLPPEYLHVLEEFAEAGEEGKLLDAVAVAAWPLAGFCAALAPPLLSRYGLSPELDVRPVLHQPPFCHRIVCRRRSPGGGSGSGPIMIDLWCQAVGRSYLKVSTPVLSAAQLPGAAEGSAPVKAEPGATDAAAAAGGGQPALVLQAVLRLALARLGGRVHAAVGGRSAVYTGLAHRPVTVPGPGAPLWLLVPNDCVQTAVELVYTALGSV